jgi:hypothetical protein
MMKNGITRDDTGITRETVLLSAEQVEDKKRISGEKKPTHPASVT